MEGLTGRKQTTDKGTAIFLLINADLPADFRRFVTIEVCTSRMNVTPGKVPVRIKKKISVQDKIQR